jgi:long-chain acyl-CoA synthetase
MKAKSLADLYSKPFLANWNQPVFSDYEGATHKYSEVASTILSLQLFYQLNGLQRGDKIGVLGRNSANWGTTFLSALSSGLIIVPILPDFNKTDINHIISHSETKILIVSKALSEQVDFENQPLLQTILYIEDFTLAKSKDQNTTYKLNDAFKYHEDHPISKEAFLFYDWNREDPCIISYTSGTSGFTKGVLIPERSLVSNIVFAQEHMPLKAGNKIVSFLPMAHVYGLLFEFLFPVTMGCHITFLNKMPTPAVLTKVFGEVKPHLVLSVPLIIEKIYKKRLVPTLEKPIIKLMLALPGVSSLLLKKIKAKLLDTFGGRFFEIVIGGAPLNRDVEKFFRRINFPFTIGYGMTECGPLISYEAWNKTMPGSAGRLVDRMEVRIDSSDPYNETGEIQVRGDNVMLGYFKNEQATKDSFTGDGWLKTGDLGIIDKNNFIYIKGRSKNMILGPSGQNIYPEEIESKLSNQPFISECVVTERNGKLIALVFPDKEALKAEHKDENAFNLIMEVNIKKTNSELPKYQQINGFELVNEEFEKTPKKNIKRFKYI